MRAGVESGLARSAGDRGGADTALKSTQPSPPPPHQPSAATPTEARRRDRCGSEVTSSGDSGRWVGLCSRPRQWQQGYPLSGRAVQLPRPTPTLKHRGTLKHRQSAKPLWMYDLCPRGIQTLSTGHKNAQHFTKNTYNLCNLNPCTIKKRQSTQVQVDSMPPRVKTVQNLL